MITWLPTFRHLLGQFILAQAVKIVNSKWLSDKTRSPPSALVRRFSIYPGIATYRHQDLTYPSSPPSPPPRLVQQSRTSAKLQDYQLEVWRSPDLCLGLVRLGSSAGPRETDAVTEGLCESFPRMAGLPRLPACRQCYQRKVKCDSRRPRCEACTRNDSDCVFTDPATGEIVSRQ